MNEPNVTKLPTVEELLEENKKLRETIDGLEVKVEALSNPGVPREIARLVAEKMAAGLDKETAIAAAKNQVQWDLEQNPRAKK